MLLLMSIPRWLTGLALGILLTGAFISQVRRNGLSPRVWLDTFNDDRLVQRCLTTGACATHGEEISFGRLYQGSSWHQLRTLFAWLGAGRTATHRIMLVLDALAIVLAVWMALRLRGPWSALLTAALLLWLQGQADQHGAMIWNYRPMLFFGSLVPALALLGVDRQQALPFVLGGILAACSADSHALSATLGVSLVLAGALRPGARLKLMAAAGLAFVGSLVLLSPGAWLHNLQALLAGGWLVSSPADGTGHVWLVALGGIVVGLLGLGQTLAPPARRPGTAVRLVFALPPMGLYFLAQAISGRPPPLTYLIPFRPILAVGMVVGGGWLLGWGVRALAGNRRAPARAGGSVPWVLSVAGVLLAFFPPRAMSFAACPDLRQSDLEALGDALAARGLGPAEILEGLKMCEADLVLQGLLGPTSWSGEPGDAGTGADRPLLQVFKVPGERLSGLLPDGWQVIPIGRTDVLLLIQDRAWLDWRNFSACTGPSSSPVCQATSLFPEPSFFPGRVESLPEARSELVRLELRIPVRPPAGASGRVILLPQTPALCAGRVIAVPPGSEILDQGRAARLAAPVFDDRPAELAIEWLLNGPRCPSGTYRHFPPFIVEADPGQAMSLASLLAARWE
jgi:hypothetical protein